MAVVTTSRDTLSLIITVLVDIVAPGKAIMVAEDFGGIALRDGHGYRAETEHGEYVCKAKSYRDAAVKLAKYHGHPSAAVTVEIDDETKIRR